MCGSPLFLPKTENDERVVFFCVTLTGMSEIQANTSRSSDRGTHLFGRPVGLVAIIFYKAIWGILELAAGVALILSNRFLVHELIEDPQDLLARWVLTHLQLSHHDLWTFSAIVIGFGFMKLLLAACLWKRLPLVRELGLLVFTLVGLFGGYHLILHFSWVTLGAVLMDVLSLLYFWFILPKHLSKHALFE